MKHIQQTVEEIDAARKAYFERSSDRPSALVRPSGRRPKEVVKAKSRSGAE